MYRKFRRRRRRGPLPAKYVFLITFVIFNVLTAYSLWLINAIIEPTLVRIAETKTRQIAEHAIHDAVSKKIAEKLDMKELIIIHEKKSDETATYSFNSQIYNRLISDATVYIQQYLDGNVEVESEDGIPVNQNPDGKGLVYHIPLGLITNNALISHLGPEVPVRFELIGSVNSEISTKYKEIGINNAYLEIYMDILVKINVIIPSISKDMEIENSVKIGDLFIEGKVPQFYNSGGTGSAPAVIMPEKNQNNNTE
ncbi:sporulation protein YunB [Aeribacillus pallidus]|uniref:Sporulation protein YunB n=1 Tax=Aeribacillus pallidus TaxID=33936 RepID=A0A223E730_9BACI|nr:sporulation protein YunB [Aeribacillus pallidus]ASS91046.1 sporulation protein YunB [Aeribacillus pallidus]